MRRSPMMSIPGACLALVLAATTAQGNQGKELYDAVLFQEPASLQKLLEDGADPNHQENNRSLLGWAAQGGDVEIVQILLNAGADPNFSDGVGHTPLMRAVETLQPEIVEALLAANVDISMANADGKTAAMLAVESGNVSLVRILAAAGADFSARDLYGVSALMNGIHYSSDNLPEIIAVLGAAGADLNAGSESSTPLFFAVKQGDEPLVEALLAAGADPDVIAGDGYVPLLAAFSYPGIARRLMAAGADPNVTNRWGETALFGAIDNGTTDDVRTLIEAGANVNHRTDDGQTPLQRATTQNREEVAALLIGHGATESGEQVDAGSSATITINESSLSHTGGDSSATETAAAAPPATTSTAAAAGGSLAGMPMIEAAQVLEQGGPRLLYFSSASMPDVQAFYEKILSEKGFEKGYEHSDGSTYASLKHMLDGNVYTMTLSTDTSTGTPRVMVSMNAHGSYKARELPRPAGSEPVYEEDNAAIYVLDDDPATVAQATLELLQAEGWQGELADHGDNLKMLNLSRENTNLSVMVQVAPAQNNRTTIQYSLMLKN